MANCILLGGGGAGTLSTDVTASKANVLAGTRTITSDSNNEVVEGTMPNRGAVNQSLGINGTYTIQAGYHNGSGKVTQSIPIQNGVTITPNGSTQTIASGKYLNGDITVPGFALPNASLIKKGVTITIYGRSVTGTWEGFVQSSTIPYNRGTFASGYSIAGQRPYTGNGEASCNIEYRSTNMHLTRNTVFQGYWSAILYFNMRTLQGINTINMSYLTDGSEFNSTRYPDYHPFIAVIPTLSVQFNPANATVMGNSSAASTTQENTVSINVASLTNTQYIFFGLTKIPNSGSVAATYFDITKIWYT